MKALRLENVSLRYSAVHFLNYLMGFERVSLSLRVITCNPSIQAKNENNKKRG